jgi:hypothetical protein
MNFVAKTPESPWMQGGRSFEGLSAFVNARCPSKQAQRRRHELSGVCSRRLMNNPGQKADSFKNNPVNPSSLIYS